MQRIKIIDYDPRWQETFENDASKIRQDLGAVALQVEHVGSTYVPGLGTKPIVDFLLTVRDSADEPAYLHRLEATGYELIFRQPEFCEHPMFAHRERTFISMSFQMARFPPT